MLYRMDTRLDAAPVVPGFPPPAPEVAPSAAGPCIGLVPGMLYRMDTRLDAAPVVPEFAAAVREVARVSGFYAGGSLGWGAYPPGISAVVLVRVLWEPLPRPRRTRLKEVHAGRRDR